MLLLVLMTLTANAQRINLNVGKIGHPKMVRP